MIIQIHADIYTYSRTHTNKHTHKQTHIHVYARHKNIQLHSRGETQIRV